MAKTRSQTLKLRFKKEECEDKTNLDLLLHNTTDPPKNKSRVTKNTTSKKRVAQVQIAKVTSEDTIDTKEALSSSTKQPKRVEFTNEQIAKLIGYIVNDKMSVNAASIKVGISPPVAHEYYLEYKLDPEHKIPLAKTRLNNTLSPKLTPKKIEDLIHYIVQDKMTVGEAAIKVKISRKTASKYYKEYLKDPERKIPAICTSSSHYSRRYAQEHIKQAIMYIVRDKMNVSAASKKANVDRDTVVTHYLKYLENPNQETPTPGKINQLFGGRCTNDQVKSLIHYIVDDKMTLIKASVKANMSRITGRKYYRRYLNDPNRKIPTPETDNIPIKYTNLDQVKGFFSFVIVEKLSIKEASKKVDISNSSGHRLYYRYLDKYIRGVERTDTTYSEEKMKKLVEYIQNDKMSITEAVKKAGLAYTTAYTHYQQYLNNPKYEIRKPRRKRYTQEDIDKLICYIKDDKMVLAQAARKIEMPYTTASAYYKTYKKDPEHKIPQVTPYRPDYKQKKFLKYSQIIEDIYKNNPSVNPAQQNRHSGSDVHDNNIKLEILEQDTKAIMKNALF